MPVRVSGPLPSSSGHKEVLRQRVIVIVAGGVGVSCSRLHSLLPCHARLHLATLSVVVGA